MDAAALCESIDRTSSDTSGKSRVIESKMTLLELARQLGSVSKACKITGYSRDSFYRFKRLYEVGGEAALQNASRRKPILKNRVAPEVEAAVLEIATAEPMWGQSRVAEALSQRGLSISAAGVRCVWVRSRLQTTALRLKALEARTARERSVD
jgi:transposase